MIIMGIVLIVLILGAWGISMYLQWKMEEDAALPLLNAETLKKWGAKISRLSRRGWYRADFYSTRVGAWLGRRMQKGFVAVVPSAEPAFAKKDALTGLEDGPSSYFLQKISESKEEVSRRLSRTKKML